MPPHVFGLTGGIATGKSTVASHWHQCGLPVVDADKLARQVVAPGSAGLAAVIELMGNIVGATHASPLRADGTLDRAQVALRVFANPEARLELEAILHPRIQQALKQRLIGLERQGEALVCYEAPLLVEVGRADAFRPLVVVTATETRQLDWARRRDGPDESALRARIAAQLPLSEKSEMADIVIENNGTVEHLLAKADSALAQICARLEIDQSRYRLS
jgi:dephospho-CoA kinase